MAQMHPQSWKNRRILWRRLFELARPNSLHLTGIVLLSLLATPLALLMPLPLKIAIDSVLGNQALPDWLRAIVPASMEASKRSELFLAGGLLLGIALFASLQSLASWLLQTYTGEKLVHDLRAQLLWHVQRVGLAFHDRRGPSDTSYRIQHDAPAIQNILVQGLVPIVTSAFGFLAMLYVTSRINTTLALIALSLSPVLFLLARHSSRKVRAGYDEVKQLDSSAMLVMHEALTSVRAVKAFGQENYEDELFRRKSRMRMKEQVRLASIQAGFHVIVGITIAIGTAAALIVGISQVMENRITVGDLLLVMAYMGQLYEPLRTVSGKIPELQSSLVGAQRALSLLDESPEPVSIGEAIATQRILGHIEFQHVAFQYTQGRRVLDDICFQIPAASSVGIVGPSGSGKTTLLNLLTRFYEPVSGRILLDGIDLRRYRLSDLRAQFSIVMQEPMLFSTTVAGNVAYARPEASRSEIIEAATKANAHTFIQRLPQGYDTPIGEGATSLSGGERQRIAIARAFLKDAPLVIMDEPTSAVDIRTEAAIMEAIEKLMRNRTTIVIAHRLSTLEKCDIVLVMRQGKLNMVTADLNEAKTHLMQTEKSAAHAATLSGPKLVSDESI
jgi:ATP-binding cassette subfamily B protein